MAPAKKPTETAREGFAASAPKLAPIAGDVQAVKKSAKTGGLKLEEGAAQKLQKELADIRVRVVAMMREARELDVPLHLGSSFVAHAMSERLRWAAGGAAIPVLGDFRDVLEDLELIVKRADKKFKETEEQAEEQFRIAMENVDDVAGFYNQGGDQR
ncbi:hypothetical protein [Amycolatopsis suaedae]|uniref:Uncharacterized protein n=1 Tax=Amycolatopsis suaedae TaxID=2510978 RepID=A0A4Q7J7I3_9PSEU|nr:hypothetical protein [Amycolatopsis suaedae]RZQ61994.1 hypothetical protein EWH70_20550 [Amycolatopsis suaedae]